MMPADSGPRAPRQAGWQRLPFAIAVVSVALLGGSLPVIPGGGPGSSNGPIRTPTPSNVIVIPDDPRTNVPGALVYVKDGNVWLQSGDRTRRRHRPSPCPRLGRAGSMGRAAARLPR